MSGRCDLCGKTPRFGNNVSHSKRRTTRTWAPNVHSVTLTVEGRSQRLNVCTRCLRTRQKATTS